MKTCKRQRKARRKARGKDLSYADRWGPIMEALEARAERAEGEFLDRMGEMLSMPGATREDMTQAVLGTIPPPQVRVTFPAIGTLTTSDL